MKGRQPVWKPAMTEGRLKMMEGRMPQRWRFRLREELEELNEVFTNPNIVKVRGCWHQTGVGDAHILQVFHGAESDIVWLQQDFNLYVVNLFDTYHASKVLGMPLLHVPSSYFMPDDRFPQAWSRNAA